VEVLPEGEILLALDELGSRGYVAGFPSSIVVVVAGSDVVGMPTIDSDVDHDVGLRTR
jgi:hypothetical protein